VQRGQPVEPFRVELELLRRDGSSLYPWVGAGSRELLDRYDWMTGQSRYCLAVQR